MPALLVEFEDRAVPVVRNDPRSFQVLLEHARQANVVGLRVIAQIQSVRAIVVGWVAIDQRMGCEAIDPRADESLCIEVRDAYPMRVLGDSLDTPYELVARKAGVNAPAAALRLAANHAGGEHAGVIAPIQVERRETQILERMIVRVPGDLALALPVLERQGGRANTTAERVRIAQHRRPERIDVDGGIVQVHVADLVVDQELHHAGAAGIRLDVAPSDGVIGLENVEHEGGEALLAAWVSQGRSVS